MIKSADLDQRLDLSGAASLSRVNYCLEWSKIGQLCLLPLMNHRPHSCYHFHSDRQNIHTNSAATPSSSRLFHGAFSIPFGRVVRLSPVRGALYGYLQSAHAGSGPAEARLARLHSAASRFLPTHGETGGSGGVTCARPGGRRAERGLTSGSGSV